MKHNNKAYLKKSQYKNAKNLSARFALYDFAYPEFNFYTESLKSLKLKGKEKILEVGCGDGKVLVNLKKKGHIGTMVGTDLSKGMFKDSQKICKKEKLLIDYVEASAEKLPFKDSSFDIILAYFMIYHMPDIDAALEEWKRILKPNGKLLVAIGSMKNLSNRKKLTLPMQEEFKITKKRFIDSISFESAPKILKKHFSIKAKKLVKYNLRIPDDTFIVDAIESTKEFYEPKVKDGIWKSCMNDIKKKVRSEINSKGYFHDIAMRGYYICVQ